MSSLFVAIDPRGFEVTCNRELWNNKILVTHPIMNGLEAEAQQAIEKPSFGFIYQDANSSNRCIYYRLRTNRKQYVKVVVEFGRSKQGRVVTAFVTDSPKQGEKLIWPPSRA